MVSMKYDLPLLDYKTRFSLWQVKMRAVLAQTLDLDEESGSVLNHISVFKEIVADLVSMEVQFDDEDLGLLLLCSLPSSYANFRDTILLSHDELTLAEVYEALQNREKMKGMVQSDASSSKGEALQVRGRFERRTYNDSNDHDKSQSRGKKLCKYCKKKNHFIEECWNLQNKEKRKSDGKASVVTSADNSDSGDCLVVFAGCVANHDEWILDTACSFHICINRDWFSSYKSVQNGDVVRMGDDNPRVIMGIGSVQIKTHDGMTRTLKYVRHIPGMARNLISLSTLDAEGYKYSGSTLHGSVTAAAVSKDEASRTNLWHMRLGHMSELGIAELMKRNLLDGCTQGNMKFCEHCVFDAFDDYCRKEGIVRHHTIPYTPQQNGVAKRMNRTIISEARCLLSNARMNKRFWAEAANTACYLINRSPSIPLNKKTPIEVWSGMPADYSQLRVFGCTAYAHVDNGKLEPRAIKCLFLSYGSGVKGYKLWNPQTNKTFMSRSVVFNESIMFNDSLPTDVIPGGSDEEQQYVSVQVEHVDDQETEIVGNDINDIVQHSPPVLQPQDEPIAHRRTKRSCGAPVRLIEKCDMVYYAFSCAEQVENTLEPATYTEAIVSGDREKSISAMQEEMQSLEKNGTWELVHLPKQKKHVRCKWIFKRKEGLCPSEPPRFKASIVAMHDLELEQLGVKTTFLHGELEEEIYIDQLEGFIVPGKEDYVCKLKRSLYGLKQSPRQWYKRFDSFMLSHGFKRSEFDSCVYIKFVNGSPIYLLLYVDDMLIAAKSKEQITTLKKQLSSEFDMEDLGAAKKILDLSHAMSLVSRYMANPSKEHWKAVQWIFRYLRGTANACLKFGRTDKGLVGYVDSDFAADLDKRRSLTGYVFTIGSCVSTTEAEYMAIAEACKESVWLKALFAELCGVDSCINLFCDSQSAICLTKDQMFHERTKHIDIKYHYVHDVVAQGKLKANFYRSGAEAEAGPLGRAPGDARGCGGGAPAKRIVILFRVPPLYTSYDGGARHRHVLEVVVVNLAVLEDIRGGGPVQAGVEGGVPKQAAAADQLPGVCSREDTARDHLHQRRLRRGQRAQAAGAVRLHANLPPHLHHRDAADVRVGAPKHLLPHRPLRVAGGVRSAATIARPSEVHLCRRPPE
uniref:Retrotransposon protein, putative, Ty1-copia subclass n=1 Tax=Oryza sativa subsp. japonica TaxID=39947 RepID=Q2QP43_ORYSJ|nr:retrotransposon protein, putative, Ty1-copia subclass [Oryza sativa Japonica Group]